MKKFLCLFALFVTLSVPSLLKAQEYRYEFGGDLGTSYYFGDLARKGLFVPQSLSAGLLARYNINFRWAMRANLAYQGLKSDWAYAKNIFPRGGEDLAFSSKLINLSYGVEFNFLPLSNKYRYLNTSSFSPYIYAGLGFAYAWGSDDNVFTPNLALGAGVKYKLDSRWTISASWLWTYTFTDKLDALARDTILLENPYQVNYGFMKGRDGFARISLGVSYAFSRRNDTNCAVPNVNL